MSGGGRRPPSRSLVGLAFLAPAVPIVVALLARREPAWVPDLDLTLTELRVRDVGGPHNPLVGLPGRIGTLERQGSHPGPISFYLLAPTYRLLGSTAFALQVATAVVHLAGAALAIGLVARRAGARWALAVGLALAGLVTAVGPSVFTEPWNPHLPILWWAAFLAAAWCALCGDVVVLPALVLAGAVCAQTHLPYLGAVGLLTILAVSVALGWPDRGRRAWWALAAAVLAMGLWAPPVVDQARHQPGNAELLTEHLLDPPERAVGWADGTRLVLERLDVVHLVRAAVVDPGRLVEADPPGASSARGGVLIGALAVSALAGFRRSSREQRAALGLAAASLAVAVISVSRIAGHPWGYLMLWVWSVALLAVLAVLARVPTPARREPGGVGWSWALLGAMVATTLAVGARATVAAERSEATNVVVSRTVRALVPPVVEQLDPGGRYLVSWADAVHLGGHGYGLFDELERRGIDVVVRAGLATQFGAHRTGGGDGADQELVVATGRAIDVWERRAGVSELARVDVRTRSERAEARRTRAALIDALRDGGRVDLVPVVDENVFAVAVDAEVDPTVRALALRLDALGAAAAVFLVPLTS